MTKQTMLWAVVGAAGMLVSVGALAQTTSAKTMATDGQQQTSAWAVSVKQSALSANVVSKSQVQSQQTLAAAIGAIEMSDALTHAAVQYSMLTGQPDTIKCIAQADGKLAVQTDQQRAQDTGRLMATYSSTRVGSQALANQQLLATHRATYCTVSESQAGL
ncbi:MAG: hypothetical protein EPN61_18520, partial [Burkholderiaceae bacterium]